MLQKELAKRLKARYDTKMDGNEWMEVSSDGIPLCRIKYNGQFLSNADQNLSDEYRSKIADIQEEISTVREYVGLYEHAPQMKAADVSDYRQLAAFGDTVLAATYSEKNGFMFCTWKQNADGDSVFWGDYSPNYEYVWGSYGEVLTQKTLNSKAKQYPDEVGGKADFIKAHWLGRRTADCIGLIKGYGWLNTQTGAIEYGTNGMPDIGADTMFENAAEKGTIDTLPEIPGLALWHSGHIGIYIGGGKVIHAANTHAGVIISDVSGSGFTHWLKIPYITYTENTESQ